MEFNCPYCDEENYVDPDDYPRYIEDCGDREIFECSECEQKFYFEISLQSVITKDCEITGDKHDWVLSDTDTDGSYYQCSKCDESYFVKEPALPGIFEEENVA